MINERISYKNNACTSPDGATHIHSNGDLYKLCDKHEFGYWLNYNPAVGFWTKSMLRTENENSVLSAIEEKPKPTKFVKVKESIFDLKGEFERGELYTKGRGAGGDFFRCITTEGELITFASCGLYRQVEIDWRDEVVHAYPSIDFKDLDSDGYRNLGSWRPDKFLELCRVALRANGEIE